MIVPKASFQIIFKHLPQSKILTFTNIRTLNILIRIAIEERQAFLAMLSLGIVLTIIANSSTGPSRMLVNRLIEVAACGVIVAVAF
jgi:hypothetical protein